MIGDYAIVIYRPSRERGKKKKKKKKLSIIELENKKQRRDSLTRLPSYSFFLHRIVFFFFCSFLLFNNEASFGRN